MKHKRVKAVPRRSVRVASAVRFIDGARVPRGARAEIVWSEIQSVKASRGGALTAADVVRAAADPESALHSFFQWDDSRAAHEYRLSQARSLLRSIEIAPGEDRPAVRAMLIVTEGDEGAYRSTVDIMKNEEWRAQVLKRAHGELLSWRNRYADLREFAAVFDVVDAVPTLTK